MQSIITTIRYRAIILLLLISKPFLDAYTLLSTMRWRAKISKQMLSKYPCAVYVCVHRKYFFDSIRALVSFCRFFPGMHVVIINDGTLFSVQKWIYKKLFIHLAIIDTPQIVRAIGSMKKYPWIQDFIVYNWCGKKFTFPLLEERFSKVIILDPDMLFFREPKEIRSWINTDGAPHMYMRDYMNFANISPIEATSILGATPLFSHLNSGILCLDLNEFWKSNSLRQIDTFVQKILATVKSRMISDQFANSDFVYTPHLMEQTMFWLTLSTGRAKALPRTYFLLPFHKRLREKTGKPIVIHYTGSIDPINITLYKYLVVSLFVWFQDVLRGKKSDMAYWFVRSDHYCWRCRHVI